MPHAPPAPIAFCITELEHGGAERMLVELATRLDREKFAPVVYSIAPRPQGDHAGLTEALESAGVPVQFLDGRSVWHAPSVMRRLRRLFEAQRPQIVQGFLWHANTLATIAGHRAGVPHILTGIRVAERRANLHRWIARRTARRVERHVCVSQSVADFCAQKVGLPADRLVVIPNGVDVARYPAERADLTALGIASGRRAIVCVGRLTSQKGVDWLVAHAPQLFARLPEHDLLLVGDGELRAQLEAQAARLGVASRVHFAGWRADVPEILAACDVLVLPSRWEGMPNVVLEAMASRLPVVAMRVEGVDELLNEDRAQVVAAHDAEGFMSAVVRIASDTQTAAVLGETNRRRVEELFALNVMVERFESLYGGLLGLQSHASE